MHTLTIGSFLFFTAFVGVVTWFITHKDDHHSSSGYFLGGRSLTFPLIAGSLLLTNLSTEQMVGLNGQAFTHGLSVMIWEVGAVVALVVMSLFFLPRFLKSGVTTVPEYLEIRFDKSLQVVTNLLFLVAYAVQLLPIILYTGATGLVGIMDVQGMLGIESYSATIWLIIWCVGIIGAIYALWGGLRTVAVSDTLNGVGLLVGGIMIAFFAVRYIGDGSFGAGLERFPELVPGKLNSIGNRTTPAPIGTAFTGVLLINLFYWCTNQQIIQRTLGARNLAEGQKGVLLTGFLKLFGPLYLVVPGIIAYAVFAGQVGADQAYGKLVNTVLPAPLTGFFAAVMLGAILSSFNSALNSTCTLFSLGLYKGVLKPDATEDQVVKSGKYFGFVITLIAMCVAPMLMHTSKGIFDYLQKINGIYFIPLFSIVLVGMLTTRVSAAAAKWGMGLSLISIILGYFVYPFKAIVAQMHDFHFLGTVFAYTVVFMLIHGSIAPRETEFIQEDAVAVDMTPWKKARLCSIVLLVLVVLIYSCFADFSQIGKM